MLSAFLTDEQLVSIFGKDMLNYEEYRDLFNGLVYQDYDKPFECVGTKKEINLALYTAAKKRKFENLPLLLKEHFENQDTITEPETLDNFFDENNFVPDEFINLLTEVDFERL